MSTTATLYRTYRHTLPDPRMAASRPPNENRNPRHAGNRSHALATALVGLCLGYSAQSEPLFLRLNQVGYLPAGVKTAVAFSNGPIPDEFAVISTETGKSVFHARTRSLTAGWGTIRNHAELDFSACRAAGRFCLQTGETKSHPFIISDTIWAQLPDQALEFMRQQRCGYNPWLDAVCHMQDGRSVYGPLTNGTYVDARGGWHDAADLLKYMITGGNATAQMLLAYHLSGPAVRKQLRDDVNSLGQSRPNGVPDLLDEARWGLEWMLRMHPAPDQLYHQVADDRDHAGWRLPPDETVDYGWGKGSYRTVYAADGRPQGLRQYQSESTGIANIAGRYAAAMALGWQVWKDDPHYRSFAERCLQAGREVYSMGRAQSGVQQGNSYKAPYRYEEATWADDMEWGAAELYRATREKSFLKDAQRYAILAGTESWMGKEQTGHYQYYPFLNLGHFRLYDLTDRRLQRKLAGYYRDGIESCVAVGTRNAYRAGVPFIWCSNNLMTALATQCLLYELMTGDKAYAAFAANQRDWLLGRNPWGYSMFTEIGAVFPKDPHLMTVQITRRSARGGMVDGPVYERIFKSLKGVSITEPDPLAAFQGPAVYHDDVKDYSSNEPTMEGTASTLLLWLVGAQAGR